MGNRNERNVILLTGAGHFSTHFFELMFPTLAVTLAHESGARLQDVLGISFVGYLLFGLGALPFGFLGDRIGARKLIVSGIFGMGVFAIAASESLNRSALAFCLAGVGLFASIYHPVGMSLISRTISRRGRALAVNGIFGSAGIALTPVITAFLCKQIGWRSAFSAAGYAACALAVVCAFLTIDETKTVDEPAPVRGEKSNTPFVFFVLLLVTSALAGISYRGNTVVQPAYFDENVQGIGFGAATSLVYLVGIGGQYLGGALADRGDLRWMYFLFHALSLPALVAMTVLTDVPLLGAAIIFIFFSLGMQPIENSLLAHVTPAKWRSTAYGAKFVLTFGVGSLAVRLVEWAHATRDLSFAILVLAGVVAALLLVIGIFLFLSRGRSFRNQPDVAKSDSPMPAAV